KVKLSIMLKERHKRIYGNLRLQIISGSRVKEYFLEKVADPSLSTPLEPLEKKISSSEHLNEEQIIFSKSLETTESEETAEPENFFDTSFLDEVEL
ncbi:MAG TPA: hypothetical protein DD381_09520, partial [Lentisphaeria bacterium]|nr:hypothetical protein [Lentisphaeria bacterium]